MPIPSTPRPERRSRGPERSPDPKRARILNAARQVCSQRGYDAALMDEIAAAAQVSKGTLYNYFASKEELFLSTVLDGYDEHARLIEEETSPARDPRTRLAGLLDGMVKALSAIAHQMPVNFQVWGVVARDASARKRMFAALRTLYAERSAVLREILGEGLEQGVFRADLSPETFCAAIIAIFDGFVYRSTFDPEHANPEVLHRCLDELVQAAVHRGEEALGGARAQ